jgi:hypothetical protein
VARDPDRAGARRTTPRSRATGSGSVVVEVEPSASAAIFPRSSAAWLWIAWWSRGCARSSRGESADRPARGGARHVQERPAGAGRLERAYPEMPTIPTPVEEITPTWRRSCRRSTACHSRRSVGASATRWPRCRS